MKIDTVSIPRPSYCRRASA